MLVSRDYESHSHPLGKRCSRSKDFSQGQDQGLNALAMTLLRPQTFHYPSLMSPMLHTYHICIRILCTFTFCAYFSFNGLSNCQFACSLADFRQISTTETFGHLSQVLQVHILKKEKGNQINYNKLLFIWQGYPHLLLLLIPSYSWQFNAILIKQNSIPKSVS